MWIVLARKSVCSLTDLPGSHYRCIWRAVAGESVGEGNTQGTLNVFHYSGVAAKNVTLGIYRLKELIDVAKNMKIPSLTLYLKPPFAQHEEAVEELCTTLPQTYLEDVMINADTLYEPNLFETSIEEDQPILQQAQCFYTSHPNTYSSWVIRMVLKPKSFTHSSI